MCIAFPTVPYASPDGLHWDVQRLFEGIEQGLTICGKQYGRPASIGIDTWGVDFALLDEDGELLGQPFTLSRRRAPRG